jgi:hypothetical protein
MATQQNRSMVSEVSICNQALGWLGERPITSLSDASQNANICRDNYPFLRDAVLEERMWTFATARAVSTVADLSEWGDLYEHPLPLEWLAVYRVYQSADGMPVNWSREGEYVLAGSSKVYMWGVKRVTDTGKFSQLFVQALAARLAADLAMPLTEDRRKQADAWALYQRKLAEAAARDGQQGSNERLRTSALVNVRR